METLQARGVQPDVISYDVAVSACEKGQQWQRALQLMLRMPIHSVVRVRGLV